MHVFTRRRFLQTAAIAANASPLSALAKATYPDHPVKVIVPFVPGGNADSSARIFAQAYTQQLGQSFVVENRGGAGGIVGASQMVRSEPDGYTIMIGTTAPIVASWQMVGKSAHYSLADMKAVTLLTTLPDVIVVSAKSQLKTYQDMMTYAKAHPGALKFGHPGNGTAGHVNILQMQQAISQKFIIAAYQGAGPAVQDLIGGQLDAVATDLPSALPLIQGGQLRAVGIVFPKRVPSLPDVPTMEELKQPQINISPFTATMAPRHVPDEVVQRLVAATHAALTDEAVRKRVENIGGIPTEMTGAQFDAFLAGQVRTYHELVASGLLVIQ